MGNRLHIHRRRKKKIKGTGDKYILEDYEIYDDFILDRQQSVIHFDPNLIVTEVKSNPYDDYKKIKPIGEGTFGEVELVEHKITGKVRAMKIIKKVNNQNPNISNEASILNELNILKKIDHQNIVKIYEYYSDNDNYYLITEYCSGGDLYNVMKTQFISESQAACIMYQILLAINYIHKLGIMHRDMKLENILVYKKEEDGLYRVKLCDFGTSHLFKDGQKEKNITGSSYYMAPEVLKQKYNFKCDLWSCGVLMYVLLTKKVPFEGSTQISQRKSIKKGNYIREPIEKYSQCVISLIDDLLEKNYDKRINAEKALTYEIFKIYRCKEVINDIKDEEIKIYIENIKKYKRNNAFIETALTYLIHNSDYEDISGAIKLFNKLDKEDIGKIGIMEFYKGICDLSKEAFSYEQAREIFLNVDTNKNNYIEPEEFIKAAVDKKLYSTEKMMKFAFNFFDTEKTGLIDIEDLIELFKDSTDEDIDATKEFTKLISAVDLDSNGKIDFNEFSTFMSSLFEKL